jgi:hypothetical protein
MPERETPGIRARALGEADPEPTARRDLVEPVRGGPTVRVPEEQAERREEDRDLPGIAEVVRDGILEGEADECGGDRRNDDRPASLSDGVAMLRLRNVPNQATTSSTTSRQK